MKNIVFLFFAFLLSLNSFGQKDSLEGPPPRWVSLHFTSGVNFIQNEALQKSYGTSGVFYWGLGFRVINPGNHSFAFESDYYFSNFQHSSFLNNVKRDSLIRLDQLVAGVSFQLLKFRNSSVRTKVGFIFGFLQDEINELDKTSSGFRLGLSLESKIFEDHAIHFDFNYDLMKVQNRDFQDYDLLKVSVGLYL